MLILRHVLRAAEKDPNVAANSVALDQLTIHQDNIQRDLDEILWERRIRQEIASNTANTITSRLGQRERTTYNIAPSRISNSTPIHDGAIEINE